jgi:hypothetical protein
MHTRGWGSGVQKVTVKFDSPILKNRTHAFRLRILEHSSDCNSYIWVIPNPDLLVFTRSRENGLNIWKYSLISLRRITCISVECQCRQRNVFGISLHICLQDNSIELNDCVSYKYDYSNKKSYFLFYLSLFNYSVLLRYCWPFLPFALTPTLKRKRHLSVCRVEKKYRRVFVWSTNRIRPSISAFVLSLNSLLLYCQ